MLHHAPTHCNAVFAWPTVAFPRPLRENGRSFSTDLSSPRRLKLTFYALVTVFHSHASRRPGGRRGRLAPTSPARGLHTTARRGDLLVPPPGLARRAARDEDHTRGDGRRGRPGVLPAGASSVGCVEGVWALGRDGRDDVPPQRP